ncbi:uncharacterized protein LOC108028930 [Drosophila biarmipes]|uniref:uncharacterized protein LOC108028930 n=1 Tax=Drosophila biarmipes TaxID=125945 RepID=UPI0021CCBD87|nr:uncharacterized protein LOC108028930 [Drosophila biarmipes]
MKLVLVIFMAVVFAVGNPGSSWRYSCNWNTGQYKCTTVLCTHSLDGKQNCTTRVTTPQGAGVKRSASSYRYSCAWNAGKYKCTHIRCTHYFDGNKNCTTSVTTPKGGGVPRNMPNNELPAEIPNY